MERCLYCYKELLEGEKDFHPRCAKKIFGLTTAPLLDYSKDKITELAEQIIRSQSAVTGVQAKLSLDIGKSEDSEGQRLTIVGLWGGYILKPQANEFRSLPELEDLTMHLATEAKIATVPHSLIRFTDGRLAYITKRIDRDAKGKKYAMEDMCQLSERLTEYKYKGSYEQIAKIIDKHSTTQLLDKINFWEQVIFSWITGNADMHLKNFSLYSKKKGVYNLTPAYDMLSTVLIMPEDTEELALTLNGKKRKIKVTDFKISMINSGLDPKAIDNIFAKFIKTLPKWKKIIEISFLPDDMKMQYIDLIENRIEEFIVS
ncbi:MAG: HipA domain-containing protein [Rikenellaceae bacterium]